MKAYVLRAILGLIFLGGIGAKSLAQCTSALSFGAAAAPVTALDTVEFGPCVFFKDFATILSAQGGETYAIIMSSPTYVSIYRGSNLIPANLVLAGMASNSINFVAPSPGSYEVVFYANSTCPNQFAPGCQTANVTCVSCPSPIETDSCRHASRILAGTYAFSTLVATGTDVSSCTNGDSLDVWVAYTPPISGTVSIETCSSGFNTSLQVFEDCPCAGGKELACNDDHKGLPSIGGTSCPAPDESAIQIWMDVTDTCYIRLSGANGLRGSGRFTITDPAPPSGMLCSSAILLQDGVTTTRNLASFPGSFTTNDQLCSNGGNNGGMFFRLLVPECGDVDINISHTTSSFNWFLLSGDCSAFTVSSSNPGTINTSGCGTNSVNFRDAALWMKSSTPGSRFTFPMEYILYIEASGQEGPLSVTYNLLNNSPPPAHDRCDSALALSSGSGYSSTNNLSSALLSSVSCANTDASDNNTTASANPTSGCAGGGITWQNSLWYEWTAPASQLYSLNIFNQMCTANPQSTGNGLQFMVTTIKDCKDPAATGSGAVFDLSGKSCYSTGTTGDLSFTFFATANTTYYILIDGYDGAMCDFSMLISDEALLPAPASQLEGWATAEGNMLEWNKVGESEQLAGIDIERSLDGAFFHTIASLDVEARAQHRFLDENPQDGTHYYRIKSITRDGHFSHSNTVEIFNRLSLLSLHSYEKGELLRVYLGTEKIAARLEILTATGQTVYKQHWSVDAQRQQELRPELASGVYFYRLTTVSNQISGKFIRY